MRIWVARPEPGASRTAARLRALGHEPLVEPILTVAPTGRLRPAGRFDAVLLTSAQGVSVLAESDLEAPVPVFAVGGRTADAARAAGLDRVHDADGDAVALARLVQSHLPVGSRLLHVAGEDRKAEPMASLVAVGYDVTPWEAYAARPVATLPEPVAEALREGSLAAALHYSRRSSETALRLAHSAGLDAPFRIVDHYSLSADVALPLVEAGIAAHFVAAQPSEDALLAGLPEPT
ncbi:uroporphyrinogen-III synthase [Methylobacterium brachythecii]|uniref:Uroporphyrinogen III methyltransferase n=1 Tax=Methylobacterium brachythecii TaxID=1176177 RepID=A0A7W6F7W6_9HYPH|nr:uroporphyrinogen-III synthase [Methylobacterium brachythecii]MBB3903800.1 uroporphyrinogen-III synthase [Methylobacterium brachythecii]GLS44827.1 uroporphyrinogen III methyltransferase [Methylobacterium brachythecii]